MRVTEKMTRNQFMKNLNGTMGRMSDHQNKLSTGRKINLPSDDPIGTYKAMNYRSQINQLGQFDKNIRDAISWQEMTESSIGEGTDILQRARQLAVQGANEANSSTSRLSIAEEIKNLKAELIEIANTKYNGKYIFSGTQTKEATVDTATGDISANINDENINYEINADQQMSINAVANNVFGIVGDSAFNTLDDLITGLQIDSTVDIRNAIEGISQRIDNKLAARAEVGAKMNRLGRAADRNKADVTNFTKLLSETEDADIAEVIMNLKTEESVYRAALATGARVIQPSLVDFLR